MANRFRASEATGALTDMRLRRPNDGIDMEKPTEPFIKAVHEPYEDVNPMATMDLRLVADVSQNWWTTHTPVMAETTPKHGGAQVFDLPYLAWLALDASAKLIKLRIRSENGETGTRKRSQDQQALSEIWEDPWKFWAHYKFIGSLVNTPPPLGREYIETSGYYGNVDRNCAVAYNGAMRMLNVFNRNRIINQGNKLWMITKRIAFKSIKPMQSGAPGTSERIEKVDRNLLREEDRALVFVFVVTEGERPRQATYHEQNQALKTRKDPPYECASYLDFVKKENKATGQIDMVPVVKPAPITFIGTALEWTVNERAVDRDVNNEREVEFVVETLDDIKQAGEPLYFYHEPFEKTF